MSISATTVVRFLLCTVGFAAGQAIAALPSEEIAKAASVANGSPASTLYEQAYAAYESEDWKRAERLIGQAIALDPQQPEYYRLQGYSAAQRKDYPEVLRAAEAALALSDLDAEAYRMRGDTYYFLGDRERAILDYRRAVSLDYRESGLYRNYMNTLNELREYDELLEAYATFQQRHDVDPEGLPLQSDLPFYASLAYYARQDYPRTIELLTQAIALSPDFDGYYGNRAVAYGDMKQYSLALADYANALRLAPKDPVHPYNRGETWLQMGEYQKALDDFSKARSLGKDDTDLWLNLGAAQQQLGHDRQALNAYDRALKSDPDNALARSNRATLLARMGKTEAAERDHAQALASLPDANAAALRYNDALARLRAKDWAGAVPLLQEAVRLNPDLEEAWLNLGVSQMRLGNRQAGLDIFNDVLARFPDSTKTLINRGQALDEMGDSTAARRDYLRALEREPANADYMERLARHYARSGDRRNAGTYFERARRIAVSPDIYINYSAFLLQGGDDRQGLVVAREGAHKFPADYRLLVNLGNALAQAGDWKEGIATYRRAIALQPRSLDAYYNLGNLYAFGLNQPENGAEWYRRALSREVDPELEAAQQREQRVSLRLNLATALDLAGDGAGALAALQEAIDAEPGDYRTYYNRAGFALKAGDQAGAKRDYAAAVERMRTAAGDADDDPERLENMANALFHLERPDEAVAKLQRLLQQHPQNYSAWRSLGFVLLDLNRPIEAQHAFEQAATGEPDEIDGWLGTLACAALSGEPGRLTRLKSQFGKRYGGRYTLDEGLPQRLSAHGYWYSAQFGQLWATTMALP